MTSASNTPAGANERTWYKDAIIYELRPRSFFDADDDGVGDLRGVTSRLDYLQDLGITAIWLLPFYPSPGRDDGYDISDYMAVDPVVGTLTDFETLVAEAHRRGLRIITELVLNHTSDQHPWFQRARRASAGSVERDFYVWGESPERYRGARIIFKDFEVSNWSWDPVAKAYYWHRFYAHQPDLNFENPAVREALLEVVDFWLDKGVDGLRLDAVPYLYEEEGTDCENLPRTHAFLRMLRAHIDAAYPNRMLLAEANQWPEDAAAYFGRGDECHMNFHFPLMPRMFMAIHQEDRFPIVDIFAQTPDIHPDCQWALFLRNHDELTLEMVTDEERDYMYRAYADQAAMRINLGIRRRLAPLVGNSRRKMELLSGLLFSLPGTPVVYYGDEIGMGDNVYLGDRNGVRTPMQWSLDRNSGFSRANPQRLVLPIVIDPEYHYESLNVENQQQNPTSLLWWMKRLIALRKRFLALGRGSIEFLSPSNPRVLAYIRRYDKEVVLVVANLSRFMQYLELDLGKLVGYTPVELFGKTRFPVIEGAPYRITLGPHDFSWFSLEAPKLTNILGAESLPPPAIACASLESLLCGHERQLLEEILPGYLESRTWFARERGTPRSVQVVSAIGSKDAGPGFYFTEIRVEYLDGPPDLYSVPMCWVAGDGDGTFPVIAAVRLTAGDAELSRGRLVDAFDDPRVARLVLSLMVRADHPKGGASEIVGWATSTAPLGLGSDESPAEVGRKRDHTTYRIGDQLMLKLARRLDEGMSPEVEMGRFLSDRASDLLPRLRGGLECRRKGQPSSTLAVLHSYVPNTGTAWDLTLKELARYFERVLARGPAQAAPENSRASVFLLALEEPPPVVAEFIGSYRDTVAQLGVRIAQLHRALISPDDPAFTVEPYVVRDLRSKYQSLRTLAGRVLRSVRGRFTSLTPRAREAAEFVFAHEKELLRSFEPLLQSKAQGVRIRTHGGLHLGHVLFTGKDFVVTDPNDFGADSPFERRRKHSPLRDLAWMVRSLEFAAMSALYDPVCVRESDLPDARPWAIAWKTWTCGAFIRAYVNGVTGTPLIGSDPAGDVVLFDAMLIERVLYELQASLGKDPESVTIPLIELERRLG